MTRLPPSGIHPLTKSERRRLVHGNRKALFPLVIVQRYEALVVELEQLVGELRSQLNEEERAS